MAGEMQKFYRVVFTRNIPRELASGEIIQVPFQSYYVRKFSETGNRHAGAQLSKSLAELILIRYPDKSPQIKEDIGFEEPLLENLEQVGEKISPRLFERALRDALLDIGQSVVQEIIDRVQAEQVKTNVAALS